MTQDFKTYKSKWGELYIYPEYRKQRDGQVELCVYMKLPEHGYKYYDRDPYTNVVKDKEIDWTTYIMGARQVRFDFLVEPEWTVADVEALIDTEFEEDGLFGIHVEKIDPPDLSHMTDKDVFALMHQSGRHVSRLTADLREWTRRDRWYSEELGRRGYED